MYLYSEKSIRKGLQHNGYMEETWFFNDVRNSHTNVKIVFVSNLRRRKISSPTLYSTV